VGGGEAGNVPRAAEGEGIRRDKWADEPERVREAERNGSGNSSSRRRRRRRNLK